MFDRLESHSSDRETGREGLDVAMLDARAGALPLSPRSAVGTSEDNGSVMETGSTPELMSLADLISPATHQGCLDYISDHWARVGSLTVQTPATETSFLADYTPATETSSTAVPDTEDTRSSPTINANSPNFGHVYPQRGIMAEEWTQWEAFMRDGITDADRLRTLRAMHPPGVLLTQEEIEDLFKSPLLPPSMERGQAEGGEVDEVL